MTTFYLKDRAPLYTPGTIRGAWDDSAGAVTRMLDTDATGGGAIVSVARAETNVATEYDVLLFRGVSGPLAAQTISGTLNVMLGVNESDIAMNAHYHLHVYVTQGDSDTPRGTLLADYREAAGVNEWSTSAGATNGKALNAATALSSLAISAGDRIVVEIGYAARNTVTTSYTGTLRYGTTDASTDFTVADLTAGGSGATLKGFLTFSATLTEYTAVIAVRTSQLAVEVLRSVAEAVPGGITVTPTTAALTLTTFAPTVAVSQNILATPSPITLMLTTFAPTITIEQAVTAPITEAFLNFAHTRRAGLEFAHTRWASLNFVHTRAINPLDN